MRTFRYKYLKHDYKKLLKYLILLFVILLASVPSLLVLYYLFPQIDEYAEFTIYYDTPDPNFGTIDNKISLKSYQEYSGIEYYFDGQLFVTDSSGIISLVINDHNMHNFSMIFGGVLYEYIFSDSITQDIVISTKDIDAEALWSEIDVPITPEVMAFELDLLWFDGTSWILIASFNTTMTGMIQFNNLIHGTYCVVKSGDSESLLTFVISQEMTIYTADIFVVPDKTIIDVDYLMTIYGADESIDLTSLDWQIVYSLSDTGWTDIIGMTMLYVYYDLSQISTGIITIYEIRLVDNTGVFECNYKFVIGNAFNMEQMITKNAMNEVECVAKSLETLVTWSSDGTPAADITLPFYYWDGTEYVFFANYVTDVNGMIYITEMLPIGSYKIGDELFTVMANDIVINVYITVQSTICRDEKPNSIRDNRIQHFSFFTIKINLYLDFITLYLKSHEQLVYLDFKNGQFDYSDQCLLVGFHLNPQLFLCNLPTAQFIKFIWRL